MLVNTALAMPRNPHLRPSVCDQAVRFALGLETERPPEQQILVCVSRGFALTEAYAAACADERDRVETIHRAHEIVDKAMRMLTETSPLLCARAGQAFAWEQDGPVAELIEALSEMHIPSKRVGYGIVNDMRAPIAEGLAALHELLTLSEGRSSFAPKNPDPDRFRRFYVVRLCEIFTAHTGMLPHFDATERKTKPWWLSFLHASLEIVGFGTHGLDDMLRDLKRGKAKKGKAKRRKATSGAVENFDSGIDLQADLKDLLEGLNMPPRPCLYRLEQGDLPSSGWMLDVSPLLQPATFDKAYPHFATGDEATRA